MLISAMQTAVHSAQNEAKWMHMPKNAEQAQHSNANAPQKRKQISLMPLSNWKSLSNLELPIDPYLPRRTIVAI